MFDSLCVRPAVWTFRKGTILALWAVEPALTDTMAKKDSPA
jgi:hypothetical protein